MDQARERGKRGSWNAEQFDWEDGRPGFCLLYKKGSANPASLMDVKATSMPDVRSDGRPGQGQTEYVNWLRELVDSAGDWFEERVAVEGRDFLRDVRHGVGPSEKRSVEDVMRDRGFWPGRRSAQVERAAS